MSYRIGTGKAKIEIERTRPWVESEKIVINGVACVYTHSQLAGVVVRFPGGDALPLTALPVDVSTRIPKILRVD